MQIPNFIQKFINFIKKDTNYKNESKRTVVVIRVLILSFLAYLFLLPLGTTAIFGSTLGIAAIYFVMIAVFATAFVCSYRFPTIGVMVAFNIALFVWIITMLKLFGWNIGVQHFLMVLLVLDFFSRYKHFIEKSIVFVGLCATRIVFFYLFSTNTPIIMLSNRQNNGLQIINTITIFWCLAFISVIYGTGNQQLEAKLVEYNNELEKLANTDKLTGLYNRRKAMEYLQKLQETYTVNGFSLCICDIDHFKHVNDTYGHDFGDVVLVGISEVFQSEMKGGLMAARWGGEEFLLLFPEMNGDYALAKLSMIQNRIRALEFPYQDEKVKVTMTFGLTEFDYQAGLTDTLKSADEKLYQGKEGGRDRIVY